MLWLQENRQVEIIIRDSRLHSLLPGFSSRIDGILGSVDKFEPVFGGGEVDHTEEAVGKLVVAGGDGAVDLKMAERQ